MSLPLRPEHLAAAYEYLRTTPPFRSWKLPHADEVEFWVTRHRDREADHTHYLGTKEHVIRVSSYHIATTLDLLKAMGHEMTHQYQWIKTKCYAHNEWFNRTNRRVAKFQGWEVETFT